MQVARLLADGHLQRYQTALQMARGMQRIKLPFDFDVRLRCRAAVRRVSAKGAFRSFSSRRRAESVRTARTCHEGVSASNSAVKWVRIHPFVIPPDCHCISYLAIKLQSKAWTGISMSARAKKMASSVSSVTCPGP